MRSRLIGSIKDLSLRTKMILGGTLIIIIPIIVIGHYRYRHDYLYTIFPRVRKRGQNAVAPNRKEPFRNDSDGSAKGP